MKRFHLDYAQRLTVVGITLLLAVCAFEVFNFDTTRFALHHLFGSQQFAGVSWAAILAVAFCGIDFAGLLHLCLATDESHKLSPAAWYLFAAWLLGATLNAVATWYAVGLTLLNHDIGNAILSREQLVQYVPVFVAMLVWLTRILFIMALSLMGGALLPLVQSHRLPQPSDVLTTDELSFQPAHLRPTFPQATGVEQSEPRSAPNGVQR